MGRQPHLLAVNHWDIAIETHALNHPWAQHLCAALDAIDPRKAVPSGRLNLLVASPECTHFSVARGGRPMHDQSRASAWLILKWLQELYVDNVLVENVREFENWGPLGADRRPMKSKRGETFNAFVAALRSLGYKVEWRILNAADYGDPTTRERLFIIGRRGNRKITWPSPTHAPAERLRNHDLFRDLLPWKPAREIIDWSIRGDSILRRKRPLAPATLERIAAGMKKFHWPEPFLLVLRNHMAGKSIDGPVPTLAAGGQHIGLVQPFMLGQQSGSVPRETARPVPTIATDGAISLVEPFITAFRGSHAGRSDGARRNHSVRQPIGTLDTSNRFGVVEPFIMPVNHGRSDLRSYEMGNPFPTVTSVDAWSMVEPFLVKYNGTGRAYGTSDPLDTVTAKDRFGIVQPLAVDILFRMLQPHELAAAMSFPRGYRFAGNREAKVKQIGNAVPVRTATALCRALLEEA
jgi:DNA (cytosine-5)-methyltransferase 1